LIHATDGAHRWSHKYDRDVVDVFAVQDEIATAIAAAMKTKLTAQCSQTADEPNLPAYEAFLKARHHSGRLFLKTAEEQAARIEEYFKKAIRRRSSWTPTGPTLILGWANYISIGPPARARAK
jgi:serine/threonine-protein kinase